MVPIDKMTREELLEVIKIKDQLIKEQQEELEAYKELVEELRAKNGLSDSLYTGSGD